MCLFYVKCDTLNFAKVFHDLHTQIQVQIQDTACTSHPSKLEERLMWLAGSCWLELLVNTQESSDVLQLQKK